MALVVSFLDFPVVKTVLDSFLALIIARKAMSDNPQWRRKLRSAHWICGNVQQCGGLYVVEKML